MFGGIMRPCARGSASRTLAALAACVAVAGAGLGCAGFSAASDGTRLAATASHTGLTASPTPPATPTPMQPSTSAQPGPPSAAVPAARPTSPSAPSQQAPPSAPSQQAPTSAPSPALSPRAPAPTASTPGTASTSPARSIDLSLQPSRPEARPRRGSLRYVIEIWPASELRTGVTIAAGARPTNVMVTLGCHTAGGAAAGPAAAAPTPDTAASPGPAAVVNATASPPDARGAGLTTVRAALGETAARVSGPVIRVCSLGPADMAAAANGATVKVPVVVGLPTSAGRGGAIRLAVAAAVAGAPACGQATQPPCAGEPPASGAALAVATFRFRPVARQRRHSQGRLSSAHGRTSRSRQAGTRTRAATKAGMPHRGAGTPGETRAAAGGGMAHFGAPYSPARHSPARRSRAHVGAPGEQPYLGVAPSGEPAGTLARPAPSDLATALPTIPARRAATAQPPLGSAGTSVAPSTRGNVAFSTDLPASISLAEVQIIGLVLALGGTLIALLRPTWQPAGRPTRRRSPATQVERDSTCERCGATVPRPTGGH